MAFDIKRVEYFYTTVPDHPGEAYRMLSRLADLGIGLLAFMAVPVGPAHTQLTLFPDDPPKLMNLGKQSNITLEGPHPALLVQGDDVLGALVGIHQKLYDAQVNIFASSGVTDGRGSYGYLIYIRPEQFERAAKLLGV